MIPLIMNAKEISESIRKKKKKMMTTEPEFIDTSPTPDLDAQDIYDLEQQGRIEGTLMSEDKINADLTDINEDEQYDEAGISPEQMKRMARLRQYMDAMDVSGKGGSSMARMPGKMAGDMGMSREAMRRQRG